MLLFFFADQADQVLPLATNTAALFKEAKQQFCAFDKYPSKQLKE
jgi:hypothetical protein